MVMQTLRGSTFGGFLKYILLGLIGLSVVGLVLMDVTGLVRKGVGRSDIAIVGSRPISLQNFDHTARMQLSRFQMTPQQAYQQGILEEILGIEIRATQALVEAENLGILIDRKHIQKKIADIVTPMHEEGQTLQQTLEQILRSKGIRERDFVENINREMVTDLLQGPLKTGFDKSTEEIALDLFLFQNQVRSLELIVLPDSDMKEIEQLKPEQLQKLYESQKDVKFKIPELRALEYAYIDEDKLSEQIKVTDEDLHKNYEENKANFSIGERRVLEQGVAKTQEDADQIIAAIKKGGKLEEVVHKIAGKDAMYVPPAPFEEGTLLPEMQKSMEKSVKGDVIGPLKTAMGFHVFIIQDVLPPSTRSFDEVKEGIKSELKNDALADRIYELSSSYDDLLAAETNFTEISKEIPLKVVSLPLLSSSGLDREGKDVFSSDEKDKQDKDIILENGFTLLADETSRVIELPSGRFAAIKVNDIQKESYKSLDEVKGVITDQFARDQQRAANQKRIDTYLDTLKSKKKTLIDLAKETGKELKVIENVALQGPPPEPLTEGTKPVIFQAVVGEYVSLPLENATAIAVNKSYKLPQITDEMKAQIEQIRSEIGKETKDEVFAFYIQALSLKYQAQINSQLLAHVYGASAQDNEN